ncbi:MAG: hypothetical protein R6T96_04095 [Longimicrobiales bacterium]
MKLSTALNRENRGIAATILGILILLPLGFSVVAFAFEGGEEEQEVFLEKVDSRWESCVRDAEWMRFYHMDFLKDIREDVVRAGIKGGVTLAGCGDCHVNRANFCDRCHLVANVTLDCFGCHFYPETAEERVAAFGPEAGR